MTFEYLQRVIDNPNTSREEYMWAWNIMQERTAQAAATFELHLIKE